MSYSVHDFLSFGPVFGKELQTFATTFSVAVQQGKDPAGTIKAFATHLKSYYGITRTHTYEHLGLLPLGLEGITFSYQGFTFASPEDEHTQMRNQARSHKQIFQELGFRYEKNVLLAHCFLERIALLTQHTDVRIAHAFLPMGSPVYVPNYVSLWVPTLGS